MKQTSNAIKFLMAQYRSIFKNAYFKGLATAAVVTFGLAAASTPAQAQAYTTIAEINDATQSSIKINNENDRFFIDQAGALGSNDGDGSKGNPAIIRKDITISASATDADQPFRISNFDQNADFYVKSSNTLKVTNDANFDFGLEAGSTRNSGGQVLHVTFQNIDFADAGTINVYANTYNSGKKSTTVTAVDTLTISDTAVNILSRGTSGNGSNAILRADKINISGDESVITLKDVAENTSTADGGRAVLGWRSSVSANGTINSDGSVISITDGATLVLNGYGDDENGYGAQVWGHSLSMENAKLKTEGSDGGRLQVGTVDLTNTYVDIASGTSLNLYLRSVNTDDALGGDNGLRNLYDGKATINGGTVVVGGNVSLQKGGTLTIASGTTLTGGVGGDDAYANKTSNALVIGMDDSEVINNNQSISGTTLPTLNIASDTLDGFLNRTTDTVKDADGETARTDIQGQLHLSYGAHINFTDDAQVEISDFSFSNKSGAGNITLVDGYKVGQLLGKNDGGQQDGTIVFSAKNMSFAKSLFVGADAQTQANFSSLGINFEANVLTLGSEDSVDAEGNEVAGFNSSTSALGVNKLIAFDEVHLVDAAGDYYFLKDDLVLNRDFYNADGTVNTAGQILGDHIVIQGKKSMQVTGGAWVGATGQALYLNQGNAGVDNDAESGAALVISAEQGTLNQNGNTYGGANNATYYTNGNPTSLTWNGAFVFKGQNSGDNFETDGTENKLAARVEVEGAAGADATLDLTNASITWGAGQVVLHGKEARNSQTDIESKAGQGILKLTAAQFKNFISSTDGSETKTVMNIGDSGLLYVKDAISGDINFNKFGSLTDVGDGSSGKPGVVQFYGSGAFYTNGDLSLVTGVDADYNASDAPAESLKLGEGAIYANSIQLNNRNTEIEAGSDEDVVTVESGTLGVKRGLSSNNSTVIFGANSNAAHLELAADQNADSGIVSNSLRFESGSSLSVEQGVWALTGGAVANADGTYAAGDGFGKDITLNNASITVGDQWSQYNSVTSSLAMDNLLINGAFQVPGTNPAELTVRNGSATSVYTLQTTGDSINFDINGQLTIVGRDGITSGSDSNELASVQDASQSAGVFFDDGTVINVNGSSAKLEFGSIATAALVTLNASGSEAATADGRVTVDEALAGADLNVDNHAELKFNFASGSKIDSATARELKNDLVPELNGTNNTGYINVGQAELDIVYDNKEQLITAWDNVKDFADIVSDVTNDNLKNTLIDKIEVGDVVAGHYGAMQTEFASPTALQVNGDLGLHNARGGFFVFNENNGTKSAVGVHLYTDSSLLLVGPGKIGGIDGSTGSEVTFAANTDSGAAQGPVEVLGNISNLDELYVENEAVVSGYIASNYAFINNVLNNTGYDSTYSEVNVGANGNLTTDNLTITGTGNITSTGISMVNGKVTVAEALTLGTATSSSTFAVAGGTVEANSLVLNNGSVVQVGWEGAESDDADTTWIDESKSYSGRMLVQTADLNGGSIVSDPENGLQTAIMGINKFAGASTTNSTDLGSVDGSLYVGRNSVQALGADDWAEIESAIAPYSTNGVLTSYGAMMYLDGTTSLTSGDGIVMTAQSIKDFTTYIANETKLGALDADSHTLANTVYFGANTALLVTADAMDAAATDRGNTALVTFADGNGQLVADGGEILVAGDVRATNYTLFTDTDGKVAVVDNQGALTTAENGITVTTENGFLVGTLSGENGGNVTLTVSRDGRSVMSGASDPVYTTLVAYAKGYNGVETTDEANGSKSADYLTNGYVTNADGTVVTDKNGNPVKNRTYSNELLQNVISTGNGRDAETVARLGMLGGVAQSAMAAGASTYDAIAGRMGVGSSMGNVTIANNTQGASLWLTPIYKNSESDGFEADNLDYGVDIDLYGVALGADFTMQNGVRVGAMFNVGSGDADGNGAGSAVSNDFDYYGFGVYAGYTYGAFSVLADVTYTVADNDVEGSTSLGQVSTSLDSTNLSVGVTGQYNLNLGGVDVTPHAGLRFSSIDIDDYDVADIASYDADSLNIFSIPVGVTFAKEFQGEAWTWKPSLDITVQGNFGDDSADGTVAWAGIDNLKTELSSEVIDNFTYGATLGVAAQTGNFSMGLGINYTGSSNVDDYGVSANARFVF